MYILIDIDIEAQTVDDVIFFFYIFHFRKKNKTKSFHSQFIFDLRETFF